MILKILYKVKDKRPFTYLEKWGKGKWEMPTIERSFNHLRWQLIADHNEWPPRTVQPTTRRWIEIIDKQ